MGKTVALISTPDTMQTAIAMNSAASRTMRATASADPNRAAFNRLDNAFKLAARCRRKAASATNPSHSCAAIPVIWGNTATVASTAAAISSANVAFFGILPHLLQHQNESAEKHYGTEHP